MLRAVADAENARKRAQTEAAAAQKYALERFAEQLLRSSTACRPRSAAKTPAARHCATGSS